MTEAKNFHKSAVAAILTGACLMALVACAPGFKIKDSDTKSGATVNLNTNNQSATVSLLNLIKSTNPNSEAARMITANTAGLVVKGEANFQLEGLRADGTVSGQASTLTLNVTIQSGSKSESVSLSSKTATLFLDNNANISGYWVFTTPDDPSGQRNPFYVGFNANVVPNGDFSNPSYTMTGAIYGNAGTSGNDALSTFNLPLCQVMKNTDWMQGYFENGAVDCSK